MLTHLLTMPLMPSRYRVERVDRPFDQSLTSGIYIGHYACWDEALAQVEGHLPGIITDVTTGEQWRCVRWGHRVIATPIAYAQRSA